jgi:multiple sugar transport system permease protein
MRFRLLPYVLISPVQALLIGVIALPSAYVLFLSFTRSSFGQEPVYVGLQNYMTVLTSRYFWTALLNTFIVVNAVVYGEILLGLGMACLFATGVPFRKTMFSIVLAPYAISPVVAVIMWRYMIEPDVGFLTHAINWMGLPALDWAVNRWHALGVVSLLSIWLHLPFTFIILHSALLSVPVSLYEAARTDGASGWHEFWYVTLPFIAPAILIAMLFRYVFAFRIFTEVWLLTGGGPVRQTEVLATFLYREGFRYHNFGTASATGWLMLLASLLIASFYLYQMYRRTLAHDT